MDDTPDDIRRQIEETKLKLSEKLETLELRVTETVQSTGTAVTATMEAVQEKVESVTDAVQGAVHSVGDVLDVRRQLLNHPWLVLGGAAVAGFLASAYLSGPRKPSNRRAAAAALPVPVPRPAIAEVQPLRERDLATTDAIVAAYEAGARNAAWGQMRSAVMNQVFGVVQEAAIQALPHVVAYFSEDRARDDNALSGNVNGSGVDPDEADSIAEVSHRIHVASA